MSGRIILSLLVGAAILGAQTIPDRPEKLVFQPTVFKVPETKDFKAQLKNGIPVFIAQDPSVAFVRIQVMFRGGAFQDPADKAGLSALLGSQWRAGGTLKTPAAKLDERLEFLAANINSSLGDTSGGLGLNVLAKDFEEGLKYFLEVLQEPAFAQDRLDLAKKNLRQGIERRNDDVTSIHGYTQSFLLNGEQHFTTRYATLPSLDKVSPEDLKALHARLLHPSNMVIAVSGKFEKKALLDKLNATLGALKPGKDAQPSGKVPAPDHVRTPGIYTVEKDVPQAVVSLTLPGLRRTDADYHAAEVMNAILAGGSFTARLMKKVRSDEGLTYGIYGGFEPGTHWKGNWNCQWQTANKSVAYALRLTLAEIERMKTELVTEEEMTVVKGSIIDSLPAQISSKRAIAGFFASEKINGWPEDFLKDYREKIQAVTREDVKRAAQKYLDLSKAVVVAAGKVAEMEKGDEKDHPGLLKDVMPLPMKQVPVRDPNTMKPKQ